MLRGVGDPSGDGNDGRAAAHRVPRWVWWVGLGGLSAAGLGVILSRGVAQRDLSAAFSHLRWSGLPWLVVALAAEALSFFCYALVQRRLLRSGGARLGHRTMISLVVGATGLTNLVPGGTAPASGWLVGQYRRRRIPMPLALWAVLAGGYAAAVPILTLLLAGAAVAGLIGPLAVAGCALALATGAVLVVTGAHRLPALSRFVAAHTRRGGGLFRRLTGSTSDTLSFRAHMGGGAQVLALSLANWGLDVVVLVTAFGLLGLGIPWRSVLFAYATAQVAGSLAPVPGGIGFVEGGMIGAFALAGTNVGDAVAATVVYRAVTCWLMAAVGTTTMVIISRRRATPAELHPGA
jgi:putative heme transporter